MGKSKRIKKMKLENLRIEIKHDENTQLSNEQAQNYMKSKDHEKMIQKKLDKIKADAPISVMTQKDQAQYILYCISFLDSNREKAFLSGILSHGPERVAKDFYGAVNPKTLALVDQKEKDLVKKCMDRINASKQRGIPIVGGGQ